MSFGTLIEPRFEPKEILLTRIRFYNQPEYKKRPVLVISKFSTTPANDIFISLAISSRLESNSPFRINITKFDLEDGTFPKPSQIVCDNFFTIEKTSAEKRIGKMSIQGYSKVTKLLKDKIVSI